MRVRANGCFGTRNCIRTPGRSGYKNRVKGSARGARQGNRFVQRVQRFFIVGAIVMFAATGSVSAQGTPDNAPPDYAAMRLVGSMGVGQSAVVVFENAKGEQSFYPAGRAFSDGSRILQVTDKSIVVRRPDGSSIEYFVSPAGAARPGIASPLRPVVESPAPPPADSGPASGKRYPAQNDADVGE